jgi:DNA-binding winged helix-turn-helix (wHTH) protein
MTDAPILDRTSGTLTVGAKTVRLSPGEIAVFERLIDAAPGFVRVDDVPSRVFIGRIRRKLKSAGAVDVIENRYRYGYRIAGSASAAVIITPDVLRSLRVCVSAAERRAPDDARVVAAWISRAA